jgi:hypothetical protein
MADRTPAEIAMEAELKASLAGKYDLATPPAPSPDGLQMEIPKSVADVMAKADAFMTKEAGHVTKEVGTEVTPATQKEKATIDMLMDRIAQMESKWDAERKTFEARLAERTPVVDLPETKTEAPPPTPSWVTREQFLADPAAVLGKDGIPFDYVAASLVAAEMRKQGHQPDPSILAKLGQYPALAQMSNKMTSSMEQMAQRLAAIEEERQNEKYEADLLRAQSAAKKEQFPNVVEARGRDAAAVEAELRDIVLMDAKTKAKTDPRMTPEQAMKRLEDRFALAKRLMAPTPNSPQGVPGEISTKTPPATAANLSGAPVATPATTPEEFEAQLKAMIVQKYEPLRKAGL